MKNLYLKFFSVLFLGFIGIAAYAQGVWKATGTETAINPATAITMGITNLTCMHSDVATVTGKSDVGATTVSYNGVTYSNEAFIQGSTNAMFYAFLPTSSGTLDISVKMGSGKQTFVVEVTDVGWASVPAASGELAALITKYPTAAGLIGTAANYTTPSVYDTYNNSTGTWNGSAAIQSSGSNQYLVMSFPVTAGKTYVVGCNGSKMMLRGVNYAVATYINDAQAPRMRIFPNPATENVSFDLNEPCKINIYNSAGILMKQQLASPDRNTVDISDLNPGIYYVRTNNNNKTAQKLIVR